MEEAADLTPLDLHCAKMQRLDDAEDGRVAEGNDSSRGLSPALASAQQAVSTGEKDAVGPSSLGEDPQQTLPASTFTGQQSYKPCGH